MTPLLRTVCSVLVCLMKLTVCDRNRQIPQHNYVLLSSMKKKNIYIKNPQILRSPPVLGLDICIVAQVLHFIVKEYTRIYLPCIHQCFPFAFYIILYNNHSYITPINVKLAFPVIAKNKCLLFCYIISSSKHLKNHQLFPTHIMKCKIPTFELLYKFTTHKYTPKCNLQTAKKTKTVRLKTARNKEVQQLSLF